jgi:hypothetical protein
MSITDLLDAHATLDFIEDMHARAAFEAEARSRSKGGL